MEFIPLEATIRDKFGTANARRYRRENKLPATIYSKNNAPIHILLDSQKVKKNLKPHHHFYLLKVNSSEYRVFLKSIQKDHLGSSIYQVDFEIVERGKMFEIKIPIKYTGTPKGVVAGGHIEYNVHEIVVKADIDNIIEEFTVDISHLDINEHLKVSDLRLPAGIVVKSPPPSTVMVIIREAIKEEVKVAQVEAAAVETAPPQTPTPAQQQTKEPEKKTKSSS